MLSEAGFFPVVLEKLNASITEDMDSPFLPVLKQIFFRQRILLFNTQRKDSRVWDHLYKPKAFGLEIKIFGLSELPELPVYFFSLQ